MFHRSVNYVYHTYENTAICSENEDWLHVSACHAGMLAVHRTPVGSGRFRERSQDSIGVLGISFSYSLSLS